MKKVLVGSTNPVKINSTKLAFETAFPGEEFDVEGQSAESNVRDQPMSDSETFEGAYNRAKDVRQHDENADFFVGIEGGVEDKNGDLEAFAWTLIMQNGSVGKARTATFTLPHEVSSLVRAGMELGHADDQVFNRTHSKQQNGAVGLLTNDAIDRTEYYKHAVILALVPFIKPEFY